MRKLTLILGAMFLFLSAQSDEGIKFTTGSWSEILEKAKAENKPIFMDCYTVWCGPCKKIAKEIFPLPEVGTYFNENFINVKVDMERVRE